MINFWIKLEYLDRSYESTIQLENQEQVDLHKIEIEKIICGETITFQMTVDEETVYFPKEVLAHSIISTWAYKPLDE